MGEVAVLTTENMTSHQEFTELLNNILRTATFDTDRWGKYTPSQLRQLYLTGNDINAGIVHSTRPQLNEQLLATLNERLRSLLSAYLIPGEDSITNKLTPLMGGVVQFTIPEFAQALIRAAAILGPPRTAQMLLEWEKDKPIRYWRHVVLAGASVEQPLELNPSMRIANLPSSSDQITRYVPSPLRGFHYSDMMYMCRARLSVEYETAFLSKLPPQDGVHIEHRHTSLGIENFYNDGFCEALSLACNHYVSWMSAWSECLDWDVFRMRGGGMLSRSGPDNHNINLTYDELSEACRLFTLGRPSGKVGKRLSIAIARWVQSKRDSAIFVDRFIDLRIALEALYLTDVSGESRFRVSSSGAWHLGGDFNRRRAHQKTLRDAYDLASKGVHAGEIPFSDATRELLVSAQDLCREGILKRLGESEEPKWNELILGKKPGAIP